jgi:gas vesicle protein
MNTTGKVLVGMLSGAAAGAILGILFAPDKGKETRRKIAQKTNDVRYNWQNKVGEVLEKAAEKIEHVPGHNHHKEKERANAETK